jgi:hypothetical protein
MSAALRTRDMRSKTLSIASVAVLAAITIMSLGQLGAGFVWAFAPSTYGDFGFSVDPASAWRVTDITAGSPAKRAGIGVGDSIDPALPLRDRYLLVGPFYPNPGESISVVDKRDNARRTLTLTATPLRLSLGDQMSAFVLNVACLTMLVVGALLVLLRASRMTWGFYLGAVSYSWLGPGAPSYIPTQWLPAYVLLWSAFLVPAGIIGFLVFCLCFPSNEASGWRRAVDRFAPALAVGLMPFQALQWFHNYSYALPVAAAQSYQHVWDLFLVVVAVISFASVLGLYRSSRGLERHKIKWVVFGLACACISVTAAALNLENMIGGLLSNALESLIIVLPLAVAYAVIRHRVIDVRFVISRALVFGVIASIIVGAVVFLDWLFSTQFTNSRAQTAAYAGIALLVGLSLNSARQRLTKAIDALFFRQWYRTQEQSDRVADSLRHATTRFDLYEPLTKGVQNALSLGSAALFERAEDGGFIRVAARSWPPGTVWHLLPGDPLTQRAASSARAVDVDAFEWREHRVPSGVARPTVMVPIVAGKTVAAILLYGAHEDGTTIDPDEIRIIRRLATDAGLVYGSSTVGPTLTSFADRRAAGASS